MSVKLITPPFLSTSVHLEYTNPLTTQKFKVRIEDPPRRRHMVFLGGAVLANLVSNLTRMLCTSVFWLIIFVNVTACRQGQHVDFQAGMARAGSSSFVQIGTKIISALAFHVNDRRYQFKQF